MTSALKPTLALLVHTSPSQFGNATSNSGPKVLSIHKIIESTAGPVLDGGRLLSTLEGNQLGSFLCDPSTAANQTNNVVFNPIELLRETPTSLTWYRAPCRTTQHWRTSVGRLKIEAVMSGLIFHVEEGVLHVAAYAGTERPHAQTPLYHAPLGNVYVDSRVCCGNATLPRGCDRGTISGWERVLLGTNFSHINASTVLSSKASNGGTVDTECLIAFWTKRKRYATPPDAALLTPMKWKLGDWVQSLMAGRA